MNAKQQIAFLYLALLCTGKMEQGCASMVFISRLRGVMVLKGFTGAGIFIRRRAAFLVLMTIAAAGKLILSAYAPVSYDLRDVVSYVVSDPPKLIGPWMVLERQLFDFWRSWTQVSSMPGEWSSMSPTVMPPNLLLLSLLFRLPAFTFDLATAAVLYFAVARVASVNQGRLVSLLWFLNPYTIFAIEFLGVPDVAAAFFTLCTIVSLLRKHNVLAGLFFAVSVALKLYPILLLPAVLIYLNKKMAPARSATVLMIGAGVVGLVGYISWAFPGGVPNLFLYEYTPVTQPLTLYTPYQPNFVRISAATLFLVLLYFATWYFAESSNVTDFVLPVLLIYFTFSFLYPQYLIWALPFLTWDIVLNRRRRRALLLCLLVSFVFLNWFVSSVGLSTPSGYSLLMFPLTGPNLPWYSQGLVSLLKSNAVGVIILPVIESTVYGITFVYALEIVRGWFMPITYGKPR